MPKEWEGILIVEGIETGDGRFFETNSLSWDDGPWPLKFDLAESDHTAPVIGSIERIWRDGSNIRGAGSIDIESDNDEVRRWASRAVELLEAGAVGVSIEADSQELEVRVDKAIYDAWAEEMEAWMEGNVPDEPEEKDGRVVVERWRFNDWLEVTTAARIRAAAIVDVPAFAEAELVAAVIALAASSAPNAFANPKFGLTGDADDRLVWQTPQRPEEPGGWGCPLTITEDGQIYGHATLHSRCHGAYQECLTAQALGASLSQWLVGDATGTGLPTGPIILNTTHGVTADGRPKGHDHLANTGSAVADVAAGVDHHGVWVAGRVRPGISDREMAALRGSALSLEWHRIGARLQVVGCLAVNSPGYLIQRRGMAASFTTGASCCEGQSLEEKVDTLEAIVASLMRVR